MSTTVKMLSIDDRMLTTDLDRAGYRNMGFHVKLVSSFQDAQNAIDNDKVDIVVINMDFDKIDAIAICKHFKSAQPDLPVVVTSVQTSASVRKKATNAGADLFVEQPLPRQYFIEKLKKLLDHLTRGNDRVELEENVQIALGQDNFDFKISDLSSSGILVAADKDLPDGEEVQLTFNIPGSSKPIKAVGKVVRKIPAEDAGLAIESGCGIGIRFESFSGDSQERLENYIVKTSDRDGKMIYYL